MIITVWTATVDSPYSGISTSVHTNEDDAVAHVLNTYEETDIQSLCDSGYVIKFDKHVVTL